MVSNSLSLGRLCSERDEQASTKDDNNNNKSNDGVPFILL